MTLDQLDEDAIFYAVHRTLEKHKDISNFAGAGGADLTILNLKRAPGRSAMRVDPNSDESIHLAAMEVLKRHFDSGAEVITRSKLAAQRFARYRESPRPFRSSFLKLCVYWYREDRPFLVMMGIWALAMLAFILFFLHRFTHAVL